MKINRRQKTKFSLIVVALLAASSILVANYSNFLFKADTGLPLGDTQVANLANNGADYAGSSVDNPQIPKYEKFELTFDINRLDAPNGNVLHNIQEEIDANTINPYWPYDPNPAANTFFSWNINNSYSVNDRVENNGVKYYCIKSIPAVWKENYRYYMQNMGATVRYNGKAYKSKYTDFYDSSFNNAPGTTEGMNRFWDEDTGFAINNIEPGQNGWQEFWKTDSTLPIANANTGISVDGLFSNDNWNTTITQPGFYYQDYTRANIGTDTNPNDWLYPQGNPVWKVRFAPTDGQTYQYKIRIREASGETTFTPNSNSFAVTATTNHGFVEVSPTDSRYFETSDGTTLNMVGANDYTTGSYSMDSKYKQLSDTGINLIRPWWQASQGPVMFGLTNGDGNAPEWGFALGRDNIADGTDNTQNGDLFSIKDNNGSVPSFLVNIEPNKKYRYLINFKLTNPVFKNAPNDGLVIYPYPPVDGASAPVYVSQKVQTTNNGWSTLSVDFTSGANQHTVNLGTGTNLTSGNVYISSGSLKEITSESPLTLGSEIISKPNLNIYKYVSQRESWLSDYMVESAKNNNIYLKIVLENKEDEIWGRIQDDGKAGAKDSSNVYASANHPSRTYQQYYWRYLSARYNYATSIHSWEYDNEGDPALMGTGNSHQDASNAMADYMLNTFQNNSNTHLASTSNWHSFPAQMWTNPLMGYADLHMYMGKYVASGGHRIWPGWDGGWSVPNSNTGTDYGAGFNIDSKIYYSGLNSLKMVVPANPGTSSYPKTYSNLSTQIGIKPGHTYKIKLMTKSDNLVDYPVTWDGQQLELNVIGTPGINIYYDENGSYWGGWPGEWNINPIGNPCGNFPISQGTYDWKPQESQAFTVPPTMHFLGMNLHYESNNSTTPATVWFDDIKIEDVNTGEIQNFNGGFEYMTPESYDVVAGHQAYSKIAHSFGYNKPTIRGETDITYSQRFGNNYKGGNTWGGDQMMLDDPGGTWWRKWVWSNTDPNGLVEMLWTSFGYALQNKWTAGIAYQNFMNGIDLSNGKYQDVNATSSNPSLRPIGQKETTNGKADKAHFWIDNVPYTWKAVADHNFDLNNITWSSNATYSSDSTSYSGGKIYKSLQNGNQNHSVSDASFWQEISLNEFLSLNDMSSLNPPLPDPVSGTVTVPGMRENETFDLQWWNTSEGDPTKQIINTTKAVSDASGNLTIPISNLVSDIALKITVSTVTALEKPTVPSLPHPSTYKETYHLTGTKTASVTQVLINEVEASVDNVANTWSGDVTLSTGDNTISVVGKDDSGNSSEPTIVNLNRHKPADANGDGSIDISDFAKLVVTWNKDVNTGDNYLADFNEDDSVDISDFAALLGSWKK